MTVPVLATDGFSAAIVCGAQLLDGRIGRWDHFVSPILRFPELFVKADQC